MSLLQVEHLNAHYGEFQALFDIDLKVDEGEVIAIVGSNGAGKSTLLKCLSGLLPPSSGRVFFQGQSIEQLSSRKIVQNGVALCPEGRRVFPQLTVLENLRMGAYSLPNNRWRSRADYIFDLFPRLWERRRQTAGSLSGGEQQMLAIGRSLMAQPRLLLLDEPSLGLAPVIVDAVVDIVQQIVQQGVSVLLVEQNVAIALNLAHYAYVLERGALVREGEGHSLMQDSGIQAAYLGV
ncbi:MAG TPA: ABC transporter ATP-binding protein [Elainellaceae cyanobacterium]|jgi:branched-chain amino acid transport system ATP-binding protein